MTGERFFHRRHCASGDHQSREIGAAERATGLLRLGDQRLDIYADPALCESRAHHAHAVTSCGPKISEPELELRPTGAAAIVGEHVNGAAGLGLVARNLDGTQRASVRHRHVRAGARVVIAERENFHVTRRGSESYLLGSLCPI
jgi:hypothetical protein